MEVLSFFSFFEDNHIRGCARHFFIFQNIEDVQYKMNYLYLKLLITEPDKSTFLAMFYKKMKNLYWYLQSLKQKTLREDFLMVDWKGVEPLTSAMRMQRSTNWAISP